MRPVSNQIGKKHYDLFLMPPTMQKRIILFLVGFLLLSGIISAQTVDDCLTCHGDPQFTTERDGNKISLYVNDKVYHRSVHGEQDCVACHADLAGTEFPHKEKVETVSCGLCHDQIEAQYEKSLHGQAVKSGAKLAPQCWDCHGRHDIVKISAPESPIARFNIPFLCGKCHKEGTAVSETYKIPQDSILDHYSESIHGEGLFKRGLTVTAVCSDCHTAHSVLPHTDPQSTIYRDNVAKTCQKCHGRIEQVHRKVIRGELWEKEPNKVPVCVDCHSPHKIRKIYYEQGMADQDCLSCHAKKNLTGTRDGQMVSMYVDTLEVSSAVHRKVSCAQCHTGVSPSLVRPCETTIVKVDCSICHDAVVQTYATSTHGKLSERGDLNAPQCDDCHGTHNIKDRRDPTSPIYPTRVPNLCGQCHREGNKAALRYTGPQHDILENYTESIHGKGLLSSGLVVTAMCTDCHTAHHVLPRSDSASSVNHDNLPQTCARCHNGIYEQFAQSVHSPLVTKTDKILPSCEDCHLSHTISRTDSEGFKLNVMNQCGRCHEDVTTTYFETFHGKVSKLGYTAAAKCYDCHGAHNILPVYEPKSTLSRQNIVKTCGQCHPGSHRRFAGYLTHATHHDRHKYPILFYTFWFMTVLLIGTLTVAGIHTALWLPRSYKMMKEHQKIRQESRGQLEYVRFKSLHRRLHILVIISFLGLAITGMTLKFSYLAWAQWLSGVLGGFESAGYIHRLCAIITFFYFGAHIYDIIRNKRREKKSWKEVLFGSHSMLPNKNDISEAWGTLKWFLGKGPRPAYGRWTYWEKFDYFAVFWGVVIIGSTGLLLWFPEFFTHFLPGWLINVATIVHSDEALLAVAFIFTVHFFNTHFRPDKFPMDTVIFTGRVPLEELKQDRPKEYAELIRNRQIKKHLAEPLPEIVIRGLKIFGAIALLLGLSLILLIIWAEVFGYK
jgi:cytochrome b subunit of formate dehydrogenase